MAHHPTFYGTSLDQAVWKAATALGREPSSLEYRTDRLADGQVRVVIVDEPEGEGDAPEPEPLAEPIPVRGEGVSGREPEGQRVAAGPVPEVPSGLPADELAVVVLTELLRRIGTTAAMRAERFDDAVRIELSDCDEGLLLGQEARLLDSLQYLVTRIVQHKERGGPSVFLDIQGRREERGRRIGEMAQRLADRVRDSGGAVAIEAATSADRRLIHNALADRRDVHTESEGAGGFRRLIVQAVARG